MSESVSVSRPQGKASQLESVEGRASQAAGISPEGSFAARGRVSWLNPAKKFGFVKLDNHFA